LKNAKELLLNWPLWREACAIQGQVVESFHQEAGTVLKDACRLRPFKKDLVEMERNLFSILFITCTQPFALTPTKNLFYARINHCLRALVTGCDNLLDDEYKEVIPFALEGSGSKFRSVMTIMTADRLIADLAATEMANDNLSLNKFKELSRMVMTVLTPSGIEEHEEESLTELAIPTPEEIIEKVHHRKTGLLFRAPLDLIAGLENGHNKNTLKLTEGLRLFGLGCQLLDDLKDAGADLSERRYNAVISYARHGLEEQERIAISRIEGRREIPQDEAEQIVTKLPQARQTCQAQAQSFFMQALVKMTAGLPGFDYPRAQALTHLVKNSIMQEHNLTNNRNNVVNQELEQ